MTDPRRYDDEHFKGLEAGATEFDGANLTGCTFSDCDLAETSFRSAQLYECRFERCELAMLDLVDAILQDVAFDTCRLTGNHFSTMKEGALGVIATFEDCDLSFCSFRKMDLTACAFTGCAFSEAEFVQCELEGVSFVGSDLARCVFNGNNLIDADLRGARNYLISAHSNRIKGMHVTWPEANGLLAALDVLVH